MEKTQLGVLTGISIGLIVLVAIFAVAPMIGDSIDNAANIEDTIAATGTITFSGVNSTNGETIVIRSETYTLNTTTTVLPFEVDISGVKNTSALTTRELVTTITRDSTLVTGVDNLDNTSTVTSITKGTVGNGYATTETCANAAWGAATLTGGVANIWGPDAMSTGGADAVSIWTDNASLISLAVLVMILGLVIASIMLFTRKD